MRRLAIAAGGLVALLVLAALTAWMVIDPQAWKPRLVAAAERATGRTVTVGGRIGVSLFPPAVTLAEATIADASGERPMVLARRVTASLALAPLLHGEARLASVTLDGATLHLDVDRQGNGNWHFGSPPGPAKTPGEPGTPHNAGLVLERLAIERGVVTFADARDGKSFEVDDVTVDAAAAGPHGPVSLTASGRYGSLPLAVSGTVGGPGESPWNFALGATIGSARLTAGGALPDAFRVMPQRQPGAFGKVTAMIPALEELAPLIGPVPPLHAVRFAGTFAIPPSGPLTLGWSGVSFAVGPSNLSRYAPGFTLDHLDLDAPKPGPLAVDLAGRYEGAPLTVKGTIGPLDPGFSVPSLSAFPPLDLVAAAAGATLRVKAAATGGGIAGTLDLHADDLSTFGPLVHATLPKMPANLNGRVTRAADGGLSLAALNLETPVLAAHGGGSLTVTVPPLLRADLTVTHIDPAALLADWKQSAPAAAPASPAVKPAAVNPATPGDRRVIPASRLPAVPVAADLTAHVVDAAATTLGGSFVAHVGATPGSPPQWRLDIDAPSQRLGPLLAAFGQQGTIDGDLVVEAGLRGSGSDLRAVAATLSGEFGAALTRGHVDDHWLEAVLAAALPTGRLPAGLLNVKGASDITCLATRLTAQQGLVDMRALLLDMQRFHVAGAGTIDLRDEGLGLRLRTQSEVSGTTLTLPVQLSGTFAAPSAKFAPEGAAELAAGEASKLARKGSPLAGLAGALARVGEGVTGVAALPSCAAVVAQARAPVR